MKKSILGIIVLGLLFGSCGSDSKNNGSNDLEKKNSLGHVSENMSSTQKVKTITLDDFEKRMNSKTDTLYLYNFWATWCKPCIEEMPHFEKLALEFEGKKFKIVFVSIDNFDNSLKKVQKFVNKENIASEVVLLEFDKQDDLITRIDKSWNGTIPATLFVDNYNSTKLFYQQEFSFQELQAIVTPLLPFES